MNHDHFSHVVGAIYDATLEETLWPKALGLICEYVGGDHALLFYQDRALRSGEFLHLWKADPYWTKLYFEKYVGLNPAMPFTVLMDVGSVTALSRVVDVDEYRSSVFYREWAHPQGYLDVCVAMLEKSGSAMGMIGVNRLEKDGLIDDESIQRLETLTPHLRRAISLGRQFAAIEAKVSLLSDIVQALDSAVFVLDSAARILFTNAAGAAMTRDARDLTLQAGHLKPRDGRAAQAMQAALTSFARGDLGSTGSARDIVLSENGAERLLGQFLPLMGGNRRTHGFSGAVAALFVRRVGPVQKPPLEAISLLYGLTPRELQVFAGIVQFGGVPEVADIFGLSPTTVRTHLQSIFNKTGVRSQADLTALAASAMTGPGLAG